MSALEVLQAAGAQALRVPADLSLTGFDDILFASYLTPQLTTARQPRKQMGKCAMDLMRAVVGRKDTEQSILIQGELIVRGSTAHPAR